MPYVRHPSLNGNGGAFNPAFAGLRDRLNGTTAPQKPVSKSEQLELPLDLRPPPPPKPRRPWGSVGPRIQAIAVLCGRSASWARQVEKRLAEEGIDGAELIRLALLVKDLLRAQGRQDRDRELSRAFNRAPRHLREQLVSLID